MKKKHKYFFWLNLGLLSTFFAEVISGADLFPFFHGWGIIIVVPLYLLHALLLITIIFRKGHPTLPSLYFAGTLFGLYEAYITKILWNPDWGSDIFKIADIAVLEVFVLVFFWHIWMSFIIPLIAAETWLTGTKEILSRFPIKLQRFFSRRRGWIILAILSGLFVSINLPTSKDILLAGIGAGSVIGISGWLWRRMTRDMNYSLEELLPNKREFRTLLIPTLGMYIILGIILRPEAFPSLLGHIIIWLFYAICIFFLSSSLRSSHYYEIEYDEKEINKLPQYYWLWGLLVFMLTAVLAETLLHPLDWLIGLIGWYGISILGIASFLIISQKTFARGKMKKTQIIIILLTLILLTSLACGDKSQTPIESEWQKSEFNHLNIDLPGWEETKSTDELVIHTISDGTATIWVKPWPTFPLIVAENVGKWTKENQDAALVSGQGDSKQYQLLINIKNGLNTMRLHTTLYYCHGETYEITGAALKSRFDDYQSTFDQVINSLHCDNSNRQQPLNDGALGMVILPQSTDKDEFDMANYQRALAMARDSGVQVSHYYVQWGEIETEPGVYDWNTTDYILEANYLEGFQVSIVINVIHTTVLGRVPPDLIGLTFDDPQMTERLTQFLVAFSDRYAGKFSYLSIGNEVNDYFYTHRQEIEAYGTAFDQARNAIHRNHPDLPVGIVFAYHDAETLNTLDVIQTLNRGDFIAYTLYLYNEGFHFTRSPDLIGEYMDRMISLADGTPIAIVETGWSTSDVLDGSLENQSEYVRQVIAALKHRRQDIHFISWFTMHDSRPDFSYQQALTFFEPGQEPGDAEMDAFVTFLCYFGLRNADGTPKPAWDTWGKEAESYYQEFGE
ncbi:MAG: hypothetical protein JEZ06_00115 [Anaerolineaceae bacterium]|nr:hypothetical protein [Anaerolineaceae bacterium]